MAKVNYHREVKILMDGCFFGAVVMMFMVCYYYLTTGNEPHSIWMFTPVLAFLFPAPIFAVMVNLHERGVQGDSETFGL